MNFLIELNHFQLIKKIQNQNKDYTAPRADSIAMAQMAPHAKVVASDPPWSMATRLPTCSAHSVTSSMGSSAVG
jgi:hypothetical protein